jgi:hypothetical protein
MDLERITHPLRLAKGSHQPGSGKGCAMNVISYINGDTNITDFPECSARPLAAFVQVCNDLLAGPDGYLSPENSLVALELGSQTMGTADVDDTVIHAWVAELLANPTWGVVGYAKKAARYAKSAADKVVLDIAACRVSKPTLHPAGLYAMRAAYQSVALLGSDQSETLDAIIGNALRAHTLAADETKATAIVELARHAIRAWRSLAGLDTQSDLSRPSVDSARQFIGV